MDPFKEFTHGGTLSVAEILFNTRFNYMFPLLAADPDCLLPPGATTQGALLSLGTAMATDAGALPDSTIPAVFTYLGQFIDHNITAQTDREIGVSRIATPDGNVMDITPLPSKEVVEKLVNGRRPKLDLNQVYGDGPALGTIRAQPKGTSSSISRRWTLKLCPMRLVSTCRGRTTERRLSPTCATTRTSTSVSYTARFCCFTIRSLRDCRPRLRKTSATSGRASSYAGPTSTSCSMIT